MPTGVRTGPVAWTALVLAFVALGLAALRFFMPGSAGCQSAAWDVTPAAADLPAGWTVSAAQYDLNRKTISMLAQTPADANAGQGVVYATVTCFATGAADSVTRSADAATAAGQTVVARPDLGEQAFSAIDDTGSEFVQLRKGDLVVYLAASGDVTAPEVDGIASAFDKALGGDGGTIAPAASGQPVAPSDAGVVVPSDAVPSDAASESPAAPELVAAMPTKVGDLTLVVDSATGSTILGEDQGGRAILAALRAAGKDPDALHVAQGYDESGNSDLSILAFSVAGMPVADVQTFVLGSWLSASGAGVKQEPIKLAGDDWIRVDYGDDGTKDYVRATDSIVYIVTTADAALAEQAAAALP